MLRIKAKVSSDSKDYRGPILFNPGECVCSTLPLSLLFFRVQLSAGPGGSGVSMINTVGELFQKILGDEYDIVGFDPRGTPHFCAEDIELEKPSRSGTYNARGICLLRRI